MSMKEDQSWSPYLAGALSGLVSIGSIWFIGKYLGASTTFVRTTGMLEKLFSPERVANMPYFLKEVPLIDWQWMFVIGIAIGAFFATVSSGSFRLQAVPTMWQERIWNSHCTKSDGGLYWRYYSDVWCTSGRWLPERSWS